MLDHYANLTAKVSNPKHSVKDKLQTICKVVKGVSPKANRVSLWLFNDDQSEIYCLMCLDANNGWSNGQALQKQDFPEYFDYILKNNVLSASDARTEASTKCFNDAYFEPLNIFSLLDFIFHFQFVPTGIICCEREGDVANWTSDDVNGLKRVSNITSMFFSEEVLSIKGGKQAVLSHIDFN